MSSKSAPRCSLQTASSIRGDLRLPSTWSSSSQDTKVSSKFAALPPSPAPHSPPQRVRKPRSSWWCCVRTSLLRWGCSHPQLCFLLLYVGCTYASGLYASTLLANSALRALRVPDAIANAQHAYEQASLQLRNGSGCVVETSMSHMLEMKVAIEITRRRLNAAVRANARALDQVEDGVQACSDHFFAALSATSGSDNGVSSSVTPGTRDCFSEAFWSESGNSTASKGRSDEVLDKVRLVLLSQAAAEASQALKQQTESSVATSTDSRQARSVEIVDAIFNSTRTLLEASAQAGLQKLSSTQLHGRDDDQDSLSPDARSPWLVVPITVPELKILDALKNLKLALQKTLTTMFPTESAVVEKILNSSVVEWSSLEQHMHMLEDQKTGLQVELQRVVNASWLQLTRSASTTRAMLALTELEVATTMKDLNQQWHTSTHKMIEASTRSWRAINQRIRPFTSEIATHMAPFKTRSHIRELEIDDSPSDDAFAQRHYALVQRRQNLQSGPVEGDDGNSDSQNQEFGARSVGVRVRALVSAGVEIWRSVRRLLLAADWSYACLQILEVVIELWMDSYSGMASVDIREISSIQTVSDAWQILRCKHDFTSVVYFLVTQAELLVQVFIEYAVWICLGIAGTGTLVLWKREFLHICVDQPDINVDSQTTVHEHDPQTLVQSLLSAVLPIRGSALNPLLELETQAEFAGNYTQSRSWRLANASHRAWTNQSATFERLQIYHETLAALTQMYDTCTSEEPGDNLELGVSMTEFCANLDQASDFDSMLPAAVQELNGSAVVGSFDHCFPESGASMLLVSNERQVHELHQSQACAAEKTLYLTVSSWWLLVVFWSASRFLARLVVKACALGWWRFFSANRLEFVAFCYADGSIQRPESLAGAVRDHLRHLRWSIALRVLGMSATLASCVTIWYLVLHKML